MDPNPLLKAFGVKFNIDPRSFGQRGKQSYGASDGVEGVQWNLGIKHETGDAWLGVNLEGKEYAGWPVATLIRSELDNPTWRHDKSCAYLYDTEERIGNFSSGYHTFRGIRSGSPVITPGIGRGGDVPAGCRVPVGRC